MTMENAPWKGKGREEPQKIDPEELKPVITFRHLLSSGLGVRNPLRVIGLCDMDAFYASCEQVRLGIDPSVPLVVRQWDALIAVNYPAREYGISRMDRVASALERCPHLCVVHVATFDPATPDAKPTYTDNPNSETHKVSLDHYRKESKKIIDTFKEVLADAEVERASIDEAFIDLTEPIRRRILAHFPHFLMVPPQGLDTPLPPPPREGVALPYPPSRTTSSNEGKSFWSDLGILVPVCEPPAVPPKQGASAPESFTAENRAVSEMEPSSGVGPSTRTFLTSDIAQDPEVDVDMVHGEEDQVARTSVNRNSDEELPLTWHDIALSIGASLMLKMRDEVKKRLGYTTSAGIARNKFLAKLVASYRKRDNQSILRNVAIPNYLRPLPFQKIRFLGGKLGTAIAETYDAKTVGDLLDVSVEEMQRKFGQNSIWVWEVLRGIDRSEVKEKPPITKSMGASKNLPHPITHPSEGPHWLRILAGELAFRLIEAREENPGLWPKTLVLSIRRSYEASQSRQGPFLFTRTVTTDYICKAAEKLWTELVGTAAEYDRNKEKGNLSGTKITNVFLGFSGVGTMAAGQRNIDGFFSLGAKRKAEDNLNSVKDEGGKRRKSNAIDHDGRAAKRDSPADPEAVSVQCPRCGKNLWRTVQTPESWEEAARLLRMEHEDFHFAQDLSKEGNGGGDTSQSHGGVPKKKVTKKVRPKGIAKFFASAPGKGK